MFRIVLNHRDAIRATLLYSNKFSMLEILLERPVDRRFFKAHLKFLVRQVHAYRCASYEIAFLIRRLKGPSWIGNIDLHCHIGDIGKQDNEESRKSASSHQTSLERIFRI